MAKVTTLTSENLPEEMMSVLRNLSLEDNMSGQIVQVTMPIGEVVEIPHNLKVVPKYRIILRQEGVGIVTDMDKQWTDKAIYLKVTGIPTGVTNPQTVVQVVQNVGNVVPANISTLTYNTTEVILTLLIMRN